MNVVGKILAVCAFIAGLLALFSVKLLGLNGTELGALGVIFLAVAMLL